MKVFFTIISLRLHEPVGHASLETKILGAFSILRHFGETNVSADVDIKIRHDSKANTGNEAEINCFHLIITIIAMRITRTINGHFRAQVKANTETNVNEELRGSVDTEQKRNIQIPHRKSIFNISVFIGDSAKFGFYARNKGKCRIYRNLGINASNKTSAPVLITIATTPRCSKGKCGTSANINLSKNSTRYNESSENNFFKHIYISLLYVVFNIV